jgi:hypothetical protein
MRTSAASPYLLPPEEAIDAEPWRTPDGAELQSRLLHWDPFTEVKAVRAIAVDVDLIREHCELPSDSAMALLATWRSDRTRLAGAGPIVELGTLEGLLRAPLEINVPGPISGGQVDLGTRLVLRTPGRITSPISPRRPGAILWTDTQRIAFEGGAARFPLTATDFTSVPRLPDHGAWALDWNPEDLESPVTAALRLHVNSTNIQLVEAIRSGSADGRSQFIRGFVTYDVARSLVEGALTNDRFVDSPEAWDDGTLGRMLFELIGSCWPGIPIPNLRQLLLDDPARLTADLQAHLAIL